jgi:hypothetical protein
MSGSTEGTSLASRVMRRSFHRLIEPCSRAATPYVTDSKCQRIGRIGWLRYVVELEDPGHHGTDLLLGGAAGAGDGGLDLAGCV